MTLTAGGCGLFGPRISDASVQYATVEQARQWRGASASGSGDGSTSGGEAASGSGSHPETAAGPVFIDVRAAKAYARAHVAGGLHLPLPRLQPDDPRLAGGARRLVVYGGDARDPLAVAAAKKLLAEGYDSVYVLREGFAGWREAGGAVSGG